MGLTERLSWVVVAFLAAALVPLLLLTTAQPRLETGGAGAADATLFVLALVASAGLGFLILRRRPGHLVGWLLLLNAVAIMLSGLAAEYAAYAYAQPELPPGARLAAIWDSSAWPLLFAPIVAITWVFPDGRLLSLRWRWPAYLSVTAFVSMLLGGLLGAETLDRPYQDVVPLGLIPSSLSQVMLFAGLVGMFASIVLGVTCLVLRFRRSRGVERQQVKWIALAGVMIPVSITIGTFTERNGEVSLATEISLGLTLVLVPLAIGIAVLRYRLYEIDRLISATVLYALLTALLGGAFVGIIIGGGVLLGRGSALPTAVATLVIAVAFRPLRSWLQRRVDRRFNRSRYDALQAVDDFLVDLRTGRAEPEAAGTVLSRALADPALALYFWLPDQDAHADASGRLVPDLPSSPSGRTPVQRGDLRLATVVHDPATAESPNILDRVLVRAGLAIEIARLRVEVRRQLAEVEASRARIVSATVAERRRLERDLHDGAQQRLVTIGLDLRHLQQGLAPGPVRSGLDDAVNGLAEAIQELRDLAGGVRPHALEAGLAAAFADLAARAPLPVVVDASPERFNPEVEAAAYFVASEGLANAVKHASAGCVTLSAIRDNGVLRVCVADDGAGGASASNGSGLVGLADRVAAAGGDMAVNSSAGHGTRLEVVIPCG